MRLKAAILFSLSVLLCGGAFAAKRAFTIEDFYRLKSLADLAISPDGKLLAFTVKTTDLPHGTNASHIWMMDADGANLRQITFSDKSEASPVFSPDGQWLAFISGRDGSDNLYLLPVHGGEAKQVTKLSTGVDAPVWSQDGKWIVFNSSVYPECGADEACNKKIADRWSNGKLKAHVADQLMFRHWTEWRDGKSTHTFLVNTGSGETRDLTPGDNDAPPFSLGGPRAYDISPDGSELAFESKLHATEATTTNNDIWLLSLNNASARPRNITSAAEGFDGTPRYSPDGRYIAYRTQKEAAYESALFQLAIYDRKSGSSRLVSGTFNDWIDDFKWSRDSKSILFSASYHGLTPIYRLELNGGAVTKVVEDKSIDAYAIAPDESSVYYIRRSVGEPWEIYRASLSRGQAGGATQLTKFNAALAAEVDIRPAESMWVDGAGGAKVQVFIVKPHDFNPSKKYPLILNVHGGPQGNFADSFRGDWQIYPGAGYVVAFANGHGSTGYGQEFTAEISGDWGGQNFEDQMKVVDALEKLSYVDRDRIGAMGWSYGGYMMNWMEGHTNRFKAIASMMGLYDLRSFFGATEELWFPQWDLKGQPWNSALYEKWSPSNSVMNFKTPALVITGEKDFRVPYTQSLQFFTALQTMKVPSELVVLPDSGHWPSWYEMALYYTAHLNWFHKYLGGDAAPWSTEAFVRNAVFDAASGERIDLKEQAKEAPANKSGKPDAKPNG
ncbi:MAG: S9 family peptidase [Acidobacteriota bacterium]